ncbi:cardiomyopathy-associated protein 5-like [Megalops cyprinoides]|uniref:cardiomyopathy-associated protein 5-like n=1 Tax=Megalops cyprinoides TaxID=118141 RepID=UPI001863F707|nr:cardiomyopathy-associated protein 5-like [Megalops cyprinoides]
MDYTPEESDRIDLDMSLAVLQDEAVGVGIVEGEDEVEALRNSLKDIVQDQAVKPKLQCVMMDPSFSMVTIQSEESGIIWETASTRCSSPWASEVSTISEAYGPVGSGIAGRIIFIMDEDKIHRRKKSSRKSKRGEKKAASVPAIAEYCQGGDERPVMAEVSVPNIKPEITGENEESANSKEDKEQSLFNIISEGYEILNIIVPPKLPTVDEEESAEMTDNLSFLEESQMIKPNPTNEEAVMVTVSPEINILGEAKVEVDEQNLKPKEPVTPDSSLYLQCPVSKPAQRDGTSDTDYFEKFTLLDEHMPDDQSSGGVEEDMQMKASEGEETSENQEQFKDGVPASEDSEAFAAAGDDEIASDHLDEVFYGGGCDDELDDSSANKNFIEREDQAAGEGEPLKSPLKESGSSLFGSQETILTPIFLSPGPPKIIDPALLDEPRAMSFLYTDLYEEAVGERKKGEEFSDVESTVSEKSMQRRLSDTDDAQGYFEKFILKDESPAVADEPVEEDHKEEGVRMWPQSTLELMGFLTRGQEEAQKEDDKTEEIIENFLAPCEEEMEEIIVTSESPDLEDDVFLPQVEEGETQKGGKKETETAVKQQTVPKSTETSKKITRICANVHNEASTDNEISKDKPEEKVIDQETERTEIINEREMSGFDTEETIMNIMLKDDHLSKSEPVTGEMYRLKEENVIHREVHQASATCNVVSKRETTILSLSPLIPAEEVQEEDQNVEEGSSIPENSPASLLEYLLDYGKETYVSQPELCQDVIQDAETAEALDYEMVSQPEVTDDQAAVTESVEDNETAEIPDQGFDIVEVPNQDLPSQEAAEPDFEVVKDADAKSSAEMEQKQKDSKKSRFDFCVVCHCVISSSSTPFSDHKDHKVSTLDKAYYDIKSKLSKQISALQGKSEKIEDLVSELELAYNSVEENCKNNVRCLDEENEEMVRKVVDQYNEMSRIMGERKKSKLEKLYGQIGTFQERIEFARETLEKKTREMEESDQLAFILSCNDINKSLNMALECSSSLEPVLENDTKGIEGRGHTVLKDISVPQKPLLLAQEASSATSTSVMVYWRVCGGDIINYFQVYCSESEAGTPEEFRLTVKESYCTLEDLSPDRSYRVWVMAVNDTGCSLPSAKLSFRTAPSTPVICAERCTVCWDSAIIRWSTACPAAVESFTLEYCRQHACQGEGLRSISGIRDCEQSVLLQPNENYLFYIKAVNSAGASERSEAALISSRGTRFHLLKDTASPALELSEDNVVRYPEETFRTRASPNEFPGVRGELLPPRGCHYWEVTVEDSEAYRIGVAYHTASQDSQLGENSMSWCIHCVPTSTSRRYELLHDSTQTDVFTAEVPTRIGTLLDCTHGQLSFFNSQSGQLLGSFSHKFTEPCQPVLVLERPGTLALNTVTEVPNFAKPR